MYRPRTYRKEFNRERFHIFSVGFLESDILVATDHRSARATMQEDCLEVIRETRNILEEWELRHPGFFSTHKPVPPDPAAPPAISRMMECGVRTGTGPMSSVAGLFARETGNMLTRNYNVSELMVENGGDIYLINKDPILVSVYAGNSPLSNRIAFEIPPGARGVSTSSGTVGHSYSYGRADAVAVICEDPVLSDAWATALANRVKDAGDIEKVLKFSETISEILGCMIICDDRMGVRGQFNIKPAD